ncbi:MAG: site-specific integrase [Polyangiaceae bacterium]|nr:site-specific integrase [Polyangiaceae bacterium]
MTWSVYQRGDTGDWMLRFKDAEKWRDKRIPRGDGIRTKRDAEAWAREWLSRPRSNEPGTSLADYLNRWVERREKNPKVRPSTLANNKGHIEIHVKPALGSTPLAELRPTQLRDFVIALRSKSVTRCESRLLAAHTVRNIVATLRDALDDAVGEELISANPARARLVSAEIPAAETRAGENVIVHLSLAEATRLLKSEKLPEERRVRYLMAFTSGMRDGELAGLTWADLEDSTVRVAKQISTRALTPTRPKTKHAHRVLPLHSLAAEALKTWKATGWVLLVGRRPQPTDPVFPDEHGHPHRPRSAELLREDLEAAGCPTKYAAEYPIDFHATRRSFASWLEANEVPGDVVDRMLGQAGKSVRKRHYSATDLEVMRKAIETIRLDLKLDPQTVAFAALFAAPVQQAVRDSAAISWSQLRASSSRPTVYERVGRAVRAAQSRATSAPELTRASLRPYGGQCPSCSGSRSASLLLWAS